MLSADHMSARLDSNLLQAAIWQTPFRHEWRSCARRSVSWKDTDAWIIIDVKPRSALRACLFMPLGAKWRCARAQHEQHDTLLLDSPKHRLGHLHLVPPYPALPECKDLQIRTCAVTQPVSARRVARRASSCRLSANWHQFRRIIQPRQATRCCNRRGTFPGRRKAASKAAQDQAL